MVTAPRPRVLLSPDARRQHLLDAAVWVFARKGFQRASIADVIERAGVARGTFYLYFKSKEQIFFAIVEQFYGQVKQAFEALDDAALAAQAGGPRAVLKASVKQWLEFFAAHKDATRVALREAATVDPRFERGFGELRQYALARFAGRFRIFQSLGLAAAHLDPQMVARFQLGMFDELLDAFVLRDTDADLDVVATQLADFEWNGIRPDRQERG